MSGEEESTIVGDTGGSWEAEAGGPARGSKRPSESTVREAADAPTLQVRTVPIQESLKAPGLSHLPSAHSETINKARHRVQRRAHRGIKLSTDTRDAEGRKPFRAADLVSGGAGRAYGDGFGLKALAEAVAKLPAPGWAQGLSWARG